MIRGRQAAKGHDAPSGRPKREEAVKISPKPVLINLQHSLGTQWCVEEVRLLHDLQEKRLTSNRDVDEEEKEEKFYYY